MKRARYQKGCLQRVPRKAGPDVWEFRWRETGFDGSRIQRKLLVGTADEYLTESAAHKAVNALRTTINQETVCAGTMTVKTLVDHYRQKELPENDCESKSFSTKATYRGYLKKWILPRWGGCRLPEVKAVAVEAWLKQLPLACGSKAKIRNIMSAIFNHAIRYEWTEKNPIRSVRQSAKREQIPVILEVEEIRALLAALLRRERTLVLLAAGTGLRLGELLGLKWTDVDFKKLELNVTRSIVNQVVGQCKTEASRKPVPLDGYMATDLRAWKEITPYQESGDWIFASPRKGGRQPYWAQSLMRYFIRPVAERIGIAKHFGWHTFRHTYSTLLKANGEDVKVVQELLRHASSRITLDVYAQAVTPAKRQAQSRVINMFRPESAVRLEG